MKGTVVNAVLTKYDNSKDKLVQILLDLQEGSGQNYIPREWLEEVSKKLDMPLTKVYDVATFYAMYNLEPKGRYVIEVCKSAPCRSRKAETIAQSLEKLLGVKMGETTGDGLFTLQHTSCFGACDISPAIKIGEKVYGNLNEDKLTEIIRSYREGQK